MNCVTIYTDASVCPKTKVGGWGCWIKYGPSERLASSGAFKQQVRNSTDAELKAIVNAIALVMKNIKPSEAILVVVTDSQEAIDVLNGVPLTKKRQGQNSKPARKRRHARREYLSSIAAMIHGLVPEDCTLRLKKVKAHSNKDGRRSYVNNLVDRAAKAKMRERLRAVNGGAIITKKPLEKVNDA